MYPQGVATFLTQSLVRLNRDLSTRMCLDCPDLSSGSPIATCIQSQKGN
jgi:hypothetical protein